MFLAGSGDDDGDDDIDIVPFIEPTVTLQKVMPQRALIRSLTTGKLELRLLLSPVSSDDVCVSRRLGDEKHLQAS